VQAIAATAAAISAGDECARKIAGETLDRIHLRDPRIKAWTALIVPADIRDPLPGGPLTGVTFGVKDVFVTADLPTRFGVSGDIGLDTGVDAGCVSRLLESGAQLIGKTVTTELATYSPGPTRNPHNPLHTPGGSSSGSAAAVADGHVHFALGTQTAGSVIRPASFCGTWGFKPTRGRYPSDGMLETCTALDTPGLFARSAADLAVLDAVLSAESNPADQALPTALRIGLCPGPGMEVATPGMAELLLSAAETLRSAGHSVEPVALESMAASATRLQQQLHNAGVARSLGHLCQRDDLSLSDRFKAMVESGGQYSESDWRAFLEQQQFLEKDFDRFMLDLDVLLTLAAPGPAPAGLDYTGDPACNRAWTALSVPCVAIPGPRLLGLPVGLQLVSARHRDPFLIRCAGLIHHQLAPIFA
jgi:Asp-tRNA(Asn)/Glu-tRNA(Gln) amidotransferase A subunit family amidase